MSMLDEEVEYGLNLVVNMAVEHRHEFLTVEHLLLMLIDNPGAYDVLKELEAKTGVLRRELDAFLEENIPLVPEGIEFEPKPTLGFQRVLQRAIFHAQSQGDAKVDGIGLLVAVLSEKDSHAAYFLKSQEIERFDIVELLSEAKHEEYYREQEEKEEQEEKPDSSDFLINLNARVEEGKIDPLIGREPEMERVIQVLCRRRKNNPLLVGESGVGKTAIAEGLASLIVAGKVPDVIADNIVFSLEMGSLLAGTKYRGDFEKRLKQVMDTLANTPGSILFIDEIHTVIGAGATSGGSLDASNIIKPKLANGELRCMGSTTYQEYRGIFEKDHALARRFQKIDVNEPGIDDTVKILHGLRSRFEDYHQVSYSNAALQTAVELSSKYITDRHLPDKAIDVIDEAGAYNRLLEESKRQATIDNAQIEKIVAKMARIPEKNVSHDDRDVLKCLEENLKLVIFGQEMAIEQLSTAIKLSRSGLGNDHSPIGSFLFAGPTGVGKTEVCRQLALQLGVELVRFDMSEYMEKHTVSRLIGAPPGYVGFDQGGLLTEEINQHPYAVLLLDEIEKAHPDVFNILLQVMDNGTLTDTNGRKVDFRNVILVMTSNAGAEHVNRTSIGFTAQDNRLDAKISIEKLFTPEFRNRLDEIVVFQSLGDEQIRLVVDKFLTELQSHLDDKQVELQVDDDAKAWLAKHGYEPHMGARPMRRLIQKHIRKPLADALLFGDLQHGGVVMVTTNDDGLVVTSQARTLELAHV
jgi:ATP-dependent Clp protease ATP-binding subunit ClpA